MRVLIILLSLLSLLNANVLQDAIDKAPEGAILKLRFVLNPFSFVFLLPGRVRYHIVLETLDTEEATYIWHIEKNRQMLLRELLRIDLDLNTIRNKGRQAFLEKQPGNFSRLIHDYSDKRKGFIIWKDRLEERLF